ncbi:4-methylaminobutanoate oxidase (formaldehyde-forming) [Rubritalea halochordaticola]|uniref:4-methylaminobutanoate oxidase (Formaldehyde-forming) n=1 Tax=Rubritalea halochordaticola TaxID=714537 RepID=A0ABP9V3L2_9BACT
MVQTLFDNTPVKANFEVPESDLPKSAQVVIVGGGIAGASMAYLLAKQGWSDIVLLEQSKLASGTTWHSAGQVGQLRASSAQTKVNKASVEIFSSLKEDTGHDPGWLQCGGLQLASCDERMNQLQRNAAMADVFGVEAQMISAEECQQYWPMLNTGDLKGGIYLPGDGRVLPGECVVSLAKGALQRGVKIIEGVEVSSLLYEDKGSGVKRITGVCTNKGEVKAEWVVLAGNMWMRQLAMTIGVDVPLYPCEHHYVITRPIEGVTRDSPCTRDPNAGLYFRALDDGGLKLGAFKKRSKPWQVGDKVPSQFAFDLLEPDWPDFEEPFADHMHRLKGISREDVVKFVNGPEAFTPDNNFIMGEPFGTEGLFVLGGWNSAGIACSAGAAKYAVEWIENGGMTMDLGSVDIRRFMPFQNGRKYLQERVSEVLGLHYQMAWPGRQMETARNVRHSAFYEKHKSLNACFGETAGWERPLFYAPEGEKAEIEYSFLRQNWQKWTAEEVKSCRESVALLDQSTFAKYLFQGRDVVGILQWLCGANVDVEVGKTVYTGMFNERGTFESDLTLVRLAEDSYYIVTATGQQRKDFDWITRHIPEGSHAQLTDVTEQWSVVSVMGPNSRKVLERLSAADFSNEAFPFGVSREINVGIHQVRAIRLTYVGELGWELHVPVAQASYVWDELMQAGREFGIKPAGNNAISTMRIEKAYRAYGHELSPDETPLMAGLSFAIDWDTDFLGKEALLQAKEKELSKRLVNFVLDDDSTVLWGNEPIYWGEHLVGYTTSAAYSPTLGRSIAMGYVSHPHGSAIKVSDLKGADFSILNLGVKCPAKASLSPAYDPKRLKVLG